MTKLFFLFLWPCATSKIYFLQSKQLGDGSWGVYGQLAVRWVSTLLTYCYEKLQTVNRNAESVCV